MAPGNQIRHLLVVLSVFVAIIWPIAAPGPSAAQPEDRVELYFFWAQGCPHCAAAKPMLAGLEQRHPGLEVLSFEVSASAENQRRLSAMAAKFGIEPTGVPILFLGPEHWVGYSERVTPRGCARTGRHCRQSSRHR